MSNPKPVANPHPAVHPNARPSTHLDQHLEHLKKLTATLRANLEKCAAGPDVDPVHDLRTGTRRVQAMVEAILRERGEDAAGESPLADASGRWLRHLKKLRRAAGPVRDLDVHRKILKKLVKFGGDEKEVEAAAPGLPFLKEASHDRVEQPEELLPSNAVEKQAEHLDAWLHHARQHNAAGLKKKAAKELAKFDEEAASFEEALRNAGRSRRKPRSAAIVALESFVRLDDQMRQLDVANLHDFRKGAKKARYIAESAAEDAHALAVGKALKKLQDVIGDWHDWFVLAEEARSAVGEDEGKELISLIDAERDKYFALSVKTVARLRGKLLGEWIATTQTTRRRPIRKETMQG